MNFKNILTIAALTGFSASVAIGQGTAPTIVQGDYVSNVFGQSNFVKNPNAKLNTKNVAVTNATATRSTTTPLVATSEWNVTVTSANGTATWATRSFDAGMKNQNCEARFSYRGFQSTSKAQIKQGANVVAELTLTPSATDPRIASINFPCGDLSAATTFVITDSATLSGVHEIGGIYVGLATNQANVAQAETVLIANVNASQTVVPGTYVTVKYQNELLDAYGEYNNATGVFKAKRSGNYYIAASIFWAISPWNASNIYINIRKNGSLIAEKIKQIGSGSFYYVQEQSTSVYLNVDDEIEIQVYQSDSTNRAIDNAGTFSRLSISRFPSSSELVVTPETQNVWGGVVYEQGIQLVATGSAPTAYVPFTSGAQWNQPTKLKGRAQVTTTNSGNDLGFSIPNLPVGNYKIDVSGLLNAEEGASATIGEVAICNFVLEETTTGTNVARQIHTDHSYSTGTGDETRNYVNAFSGVFNNTSVATRNFRMLAQKHTGITSAGCLAYANTGTNQNNSNISIIMTPLDNAPNSALYVQGPVRAGNTGTAAPAGYIGEVINSTSATSGTVANGLSTATRMTITLTPGTWLLHGSLRFNSNVTYNFNTLSISSGTAVDPSSSIQPQPAVAGSWNTHANLSKVVTVTSNVTFYLVTDTWITSGSATYDNAIFTATRIGSN